MSGCRQESDHRHETIALFGAGRVRDTVHRYPEQRDGILGFEQPPRLIARASIEKRAEHGYENHGNRRWYAAGSTTPAGHFPTGDHHAAPVHRLHDRVETDSEAGVRFTVVPEAEGRRTGAARGWNGQRDKRRNINRTGNR
jgi:hypothetical protein